MKKTLQNFAALLFVTTLLTVNATAQTWQWGKRGGGAFNGGNMTPHEKVIDIATDKWGNVYLLAYIITPGTPNVDGNTVVGYGERDIIVSSFTCNGTYRWSKLIGGNSPDLPGSIAVDTLGHVYVTGKVIPPNQAGDEVHYSTDTVQVVGNEKSLFIAQYDTAGNFKWLRQPTTDTSTFVRSGVYSQSYDLMVTGNGDAYWFVAMPKGLLSGGGGRVAPQDSVYIIKYNAAGIMNDLIIPEMNATRAGFTTIHMNRTPSGKFIFSGGQQFYTSTPVFSIGGQNITHTMFIAAFSATGQYLWKKENSSNVNNVGIIHSRPAIDQQENIYISGTFQKGDTLNSYVFTSPVFNNTTTSSFISKMDISGNHLWTRNAGANAVNLYNSVVIRNAGEVWMSGSSPSLWWDSINHIQGQVNGGYHLFVTRLNGQGIIISMDSLKGSFGSLNYAYASAADRNGNLYIGGEFDGTLNVGTQALNKYGGASDFFIAKLGTNLCGCVLPSPSFAKTINARTVSFTYNGTTTSVDSVVWNYGNSVKATKTGSAMTAPFSYTYPAKGTYNVCATAYSACGANQSCQSVTVSNVGISTIGLSNIKVYPNPAKDFVTVEGANEGTTSSVVNLLGQEVIAASSLSAKQNIFLASLSPGTYLLVLTDRDGQRNTVRIVKQ